MFEEVRFATDRITKEYPDIARKLLYLVEDVERLIVPDSIATVPDDVHMLSTFLYRGNSQDDLSGQCQGVSFGDTAPSLLHNHNTWITPISPNANNTRVNSQDLDELAVASHGFRGRNVQRVSAMGSKSSGEGRGHNVGEGSRLAPPPEPRLKGLSRSTDDLGAALDGDGPDYGFYDLSEHLHSQHLKATAA